jgi:type III restriction enzyme
MAEGSEKISQLVINSPYEEPKHHWSYERETRLFRLKDGRRAAGFLRASEVSQSFDDPGEFIELPLVNRIRPRVRAWREAGFPGVTGITKRLLGHWRDPEQRESRRFFFCQLEAIETLIWLTESAEAERQGIEIPSDGGEFQRVCCKMATGSGKTIVMAMLIAWQVLNKATYPQDQRFSKNVLVVAPGLTVKSRLSVLNLGPGSFYDEFDVVPPGLAERFRQGRIVIHNWHLLQSLDPSDGPRVVKKGPESAEAFCRRVLGDLSTASGILVINDEAHHAWRVPPKAGPKGETREEAAAIDEATEWIGGLDRIHSAKSIARCFDFTATPFAPTGRRSGEETLFEWIVSDFGLNDAIESGLVKTPRVVIRDDKLPSVRTYKSKLYHIYPEVRDDLNRRAEAHEPLPDLVLNAYYLLGADWLQAYHEWVKRDSPTPPVMITVANRTETAARIRYSFEKGKIRVDELSDPTHILHIDSRVLAQIETLDEEPTTPLGEAPEDDSAGEEGDEGPGETLPKLTKSEQAVRLRRQVDTVGQQGKPGEQVRNVISVGMLSEGWDAKTVTHIMGLRAFTSQLLCEQVVGRGLRRTSYDVNSETGLLEPEYVNIFGVPFTFLPHEQADGPPPPPQPPKTLIGPDPSKKQYELAWPNVVRIDHTYKPVLKLEASRLPPLQLDVTEARELAELAPIIDGKPDFRKISEIDLAKLAERLRMQRIVFEAARDVFDLMKPSWKGNRDYLLAQLIALIERFLASDRILINPRGYADDPTRRRLVLTLNMSRVVQHMWEAIRFENTETLEPVFDELAPIRSTGDMRPWYTGRPCEHTSRSHINQCVYDSTWESSEASELDRSNLVDSWVKNDHLGYEILYTHNGVVKKYRPDFLVRLKGGRMLVLEVKGQDADEHRTKREFLAEWIRAVNSHGGFGRWSADVSFDPSDLRAILTRHARTDPGPSEGPGAEKPGFGGQVSFGVTGKLKGTASLKNWKKGQT